MKINTACETCAPKFEVSRENPNDCKDISIVYDERLTKAQLVLSAILLLRPDELEDFIVGLRPQFIPNDDRHGAR